MTISHKNIRYRVLPPLDVPADTALKALHLIMRDAKLMTLALRMGDRVHVNTAYFAASDDRSRLWFLSERDSHHAKLIRTGAACGINIFCEPKNWGDPIRGVQFEASAVPATGDAETSASAAYRAKFKGSEQYLAQGLIGDFANSSYFVCQIARAKVIDQAMFGDEIYMTLEATSIDEPSS